MPQSLIESCGTMPALQVPKECCLHLCNGFPALQPAPPHSCQTPLRPPLDPGRRVGPSSFLPMEALAVCVWLASVSDRSFPQEYP